MKIYLIYALFITFSLVGLLLNSREILLGNLFTILAFNAYQIMNINDVSLIKPNNKGGK